MKEQLEQRIELLGEVLRKRNETVTECEVALHDAKMNRDRVAGGIIELEYALEQAALPADDNEKVKGKIPAAGP